MAVSNPCASPGAGLATYISLIRLERCPLLKSKLSRPLSSPLLPSPTMPSSPLEEKEPLNQLKRLPSELLVIILSLLPLNALAFATKTSKRINAIYKDNLKPILFSVFQEEYDSVYILKAGVMFWKPLRAVYDEHALENASIILLEVAWHMLQQRELQAHVARNARNQTPYQQVWHAIALLS